MTALLIVAILSGGILLAFFLGAVWTACTTEHDEVQLAEDERADFSD